MAARLSRLKIADITNSSAVIRDKVTLRIERGKITDSQCEVVVTSIVEEVGPVEDIGLLRESCKHILQCACPAFDYHESARTRLQDKVCKCLTKVSVKECSSICFPPLGTGVGYTPESVAMWMIEAIDSYCDLFPRSSLTHVSILIYERDVDTQEGFDNVMYNLMSSRKADRHLSDITKTSMVIGGEVKLAIRTGDITNCTEDVVVNSTTTHLDLSRGRVAAALARKAGPKLGAACQAISPLNSCEVKETAAYNLSCKSILHCNCPIYKSVELTKPKLQNIVKKCLSTAAINSHSSISFPALGTGNLKYPPQLVAKWMVEQIIDHCEMFPRCSITNIKIVLHDEDTETQQGFAEYMESHVYRDVSDTHLLIYNRIHFDAVLGNLANSTEDTVVNSTEDDYDLTSPVSRSLAERGGERFAQVCAGLRPFIKGSVVKTSSFGIPCRQILHTNCERWSCDTRPIQETVTGCLTVAANSGHRSIAFPTIGLEDKGYSPEHVCEGIVESVAKYSVSNPHSCLTTVKVYLHEGLSVEQLEIFRWGLRMLGCERQDHGFLLAHETKLTFARGDLAETKVDMIVNSTGSHMMLSGGNVSVQLMNRAGEALQDECTRLGPMITGQIVMTGGFGLPCDHVLHVCCPSWKTGQSEKELRDLMMRCLYWAHDYRVSSIAFPAVGTGMLKYPPQSVARCLVHAAADFARLNRMTTVKHIMMVVYSKDDDTVVEGIEEALNIELLLQKGDSESGAKPKSDSGGKLVLDLPQSWQPPTHKYMEFTVAAGTREYTDVVADLDKTIGRPGYQIIQVIRIQNPDTYRLYDVLRQSVARRVGKSRDVETAPLWHGTSKDSVQLITHGKFDRGLAAKNGSMLGKAAYFSTSAKYSSQHTFSPPDANGVRHMILARVITGDYCLGRPGLRQAPYKDPNSPISDQYDSVADCVDEPTMYAVFHDASAYPEYVIKYTY